MKTAKTFLCVLAATLAVTVFAAKEPTICATKAKAVCKKAECKPCVALPAGSVLQKEFSDDVTQSFKAPDGRLMCKPAATRPAM